MVDVKIKIERFDLFSGGTSSYNYETQSIILRRWITEELVEVALNHEYLHAVIHKLEGLETSRKLDRLFYDKKGRIIRGYNPKTKTLDGMDEYGVPK